MRKISNTNDIPHYQSTIVQSMDWFNSVWQSNWNWYIAVSPTIYDFNDYSSIIGECCVSDWEYCVFMNLSRESADDTLYMYITRYRISDWFLDINRYIWVWYTTSVTSVKYYSWHIYITHVDQWTYRYEDYTISTWWMSWTLWQYTWPWTDVDNTPIQLNWYKMSSKMNTDSFSWNRYHKNHIRMEKII